MDPGEGAPRIKAENLMIFVDGESFLTAVRRLFYREFNREDYLPQAAQWRWFFNSISRLVGATSYKVNWYSIKELDYLPYADWEHGTYEVCERKLSQMAGISEELNRKTTKKGREKVVNHYRKLFSENMRTMQARLEKWHRLQDEVSRECPEVQFRRPGWQACHLESFKLEKEKGVDIGLAVDLALCEAEYDTALLFSGDGDFVPAVKAMRARGKQIGNVEYECRDGTIFRGTARRLANSVDFTLEIPFGDMADFLGIDLKDANAA